MFGFHQVRNMLHIVYIYLYKGVYMRLSPYLNFDGKAEEALIFIDQSLVVSSQHSCATRTWLQMKIP